MLYLDDTVALCFGIGKKMNELKGGVLVDMISSIQAGLSDAMGKATKFTALCYESKSHFQVHGKD